MAPLTYVDWDTFQKLRAKRADTVVYYVETSETVEAQCDLEGRTIAVILRKDAGNQAAGTSVEVLIQSWLKDAFEVQAFSREK